MLKLLVLPIASLMLISCSNGGSSSNPAPNAAPPVVEAQNALLGTWETPVLLDAKGGEYKKSINFTEDTITYKYIATKTSGELYDQEIVIHTYSHDGSKVDRLEKTSLFYATSSDNETNVFNEYSIYNMNDWVTYESKDLTPFYISGEYEGNSPIIPASEDETTVVYTSYSINENELTITVHYDYKNFQDDYEDVLVFSKVD